MESKILVIHDRSVINALEHQKKVNRRMGAALVLLTASVYLLLKVSEAHEKKLTKLLNLENLETEGE